MLGQGRTNLGQGRQGGRADVIDANGEILAFAGVDDVALTALGQGVGGFEDLTRSVDRLTVGQAAFGGEGRQLDQASTDGLSSVSQVLAVLTGLLVLLDLGVGRALDVFGAQFLDQGAADAFQRGGRAGGHAGHLGDRKAEAALDRVGDLIGGQGEDGGADGGVAEGALRRVVVVAGLNLVGGGDFGRGLAGAQVGGDAVGGGLGRRRQGDEGALFGVRQGGLAELEALADALLGDRRRLAVGARIEQHDRNHAEFGTAQLGGVFVEEGGQLGVGRRRRRAGHGLCHVEPATVARFQRLTGEQGAIDARHPGAGEDGGAELAGDVLVAQILFEHFGSQALGGERLFIAVLIELTADLVEEGGDLTDFLQNQFLAGPDAGVPGPGQEAEALRLAFQVLGVDVFLDHVLEGHGTTGLLLQVVAHTLEIAAELLGADAAIAGVDDMFRAEAREDI
ncbi:hypothetical protein D3C80_943930 [compost metagenome]